MAASEQQQKVSGQMFRVIYHILEKLKRQTGQIIIKVQGQSLRLVEFGKANASFLTRVFEVENSRGDGTVDKPNAIYATAFNLEILLGIIYGRISKIFLRDGQ